MIRLNHIVLFQLNNKIFLWQSLKLYQLAFAFVNELNGRGLSRLIFGSVKKVNLSQLSLMSVKHSTLSLESYNWYNCLRLNAFDKCTSAKFSQLASGMLSFSKMFCSLECVKYVKLTVDCKTVRQELKNVDTLTSL